MRKIWITVLLLVFTINLTGCGLNNNKNSTETNTTEATPAVEQEEKNKVSQEDQAVAPTEAVEPTKDLEPSIKPDAETVEGDASTVYMTKDISPEGLIKIYEALDRKATGKVAIKVHMGEPGGNNYLAPKLVKDFVLSVNGTFVDCNTAYGGLRTNTAAHLKAAEDHGFTEYASVDILDADGSVSLPVENGKHLKEDMVGSHFKDYDFYIVLSHFKGHQMGGFGGAIKNMSIGFASVKGKNLIHTSGKSETKTWGGGGYIQDEFLESMAEAAKAVSDDAGKNILYISVMNNLSIDCDCNPHPAAPAMEDIGIFASLDPVALDKACVDQVYAADKEVSAGLRTRIETKNGTHTLDYAEELGLGSQRYELVTIDE